MRNYLIINSKELTKVDFYQIIETSPDTLAYSFDGSKTFIKWENDQPDFVDDFKWKEGPYSHDEMLEVLRGEEWTFIPEVV